MTILMEKIAIASSDGVNIDQHFGRADFFYIYDIGDDDSISQCEQRNFPSESDGRDHIEAAIELLSDVKYVLCAQIGPHAIQALASSNIVGYALPGDVQKTLRNYVKRRGLVKNLAACRGPNLPAWGINCGGCSGGNCGT
jgi:nitrogen fixation protein NifB